MHRATPGSQHTLPSKTYRAADTKPSSTGASSQVTFGSTWVALLHAEIATLAALGQHAPLEQQTFVALAGMLMSLLLSNKSLMDSGTMNAWQSVALAVEVCLGMQRLPCKAADCGTNIVGAACPQVHSAGTLMRMHQSLEDRARRARLPSFQ